MPTDPPRFEQHSGHAPSVRRVTDYGWLTDQVHLLLEAHVHDLDDPTAEGRDAIRAAVAAGADRFLGDDALTEGD